MPRRARISGWIWDSASQPISPPRAALEDSSLRRAAMSGKAAGEVLSSLRTASSLDLALASSAGAACLGAAMKIWASRHERGTASWGLAAS